MALLGITLLICVMGSVCMGIETPKYEVVHSEPEFEIRLYSQSSWMSASIPRLSFAKATRIGYHRLFQYIEGANLNSSRIPMTIPVLTRIVPGPDSSRRPIADSIRFLLPEKFQADPPLPLPELSLSPFSSEAHCVAVRKFSGFARDRNIGREAERLFASLDGSSFSRSGAAYTVAQYSSPFKFTDRLNEVWVDVGGPGTNPNDCVGGVGIASY